MLIQSSDIRLEKRQVRQRIGSLLKRMSEDDYTRFNAQVYERFFSLKIVRQAQAIMIYYSIAHEVETHSIIKQLLGQGKRVGLPVCREDRSLDVREIISLNQVVRKDFKTFSLYEPGKETSIIPADDLDLVIIPGIAFDLDGNRLGHGAGYYDRFLHNLPSHIYRLGLAYQFQVIPYVPVSKYDIPVNGLLTEERFYDIGL